MFGITNENKTHIKSPKHTLFVVWKNEYKSRSQLANALIDPDICASSAGSTKYLEQPLKYETNALLKITQLKPSE